MLEHVSLHMRPGECVAIVGPSGSGKSAIADLVLRMLDPDAGTVRLDGHDLRTVCRASGFPRPVPGVPPERNLKGISFAVANVTGVLARELAGGSRPSLTTAIAALQPA